MAIANAKLAYQRYLEFCGTAAWQRLAAKGAHPQRLLWASTSTKNPQYRDVRYVEELIGRDTVNTIPPATLEAFRDHGRLRASLEQDVDGARTIIEALERVGISLNDVTDTLVEDGVTLFSEAFDTLLAAVDTGTTRRAEVDARSAALHPSRRSRGQGHRRRGRLAEVRQGAAAVGTRRHALDRQRRRPLAGLARHHRRPGGAQRSVEGGRPGGGRRRRLARRAPRHGRIEPVSGGHAKDLRHHQGLSGAACAGLDRPRTDRRDRARGGPDAHALHRVEQVRHDTRTQHPAAVLS